jgi:hypothetical protein
MKLLRRLKNWLESIGITVPQKKEWKFVTVVAIILMGCAALPMLVGLVHARPFVVTGFGDLLNGDVPAYMDVMWQARHHHFLFNDQLTPEPNPHVVFRPLFLVLGLISGVTNLLPAVIWNVAIVVLAGIFAYVAYFFIAQFFSARHERRLTHLLMLTSGGVGFLHYTFGDLWDKRMGHLPHPFDVVVPESNIFMSLTNAAHFSYSLILLLLVVIFLWRGVKRPLTASVTLFFLGLLLILEHPYDVPTLALIGVSAFLVAAFKKERVFSILSRCVGLAAGVIVASAAIWLGISHSEAFQTIAKNNALDPGPWHALVAGYGFILVLALVGFLARWKSRTNWFLLLWVAGQLVLIYGPWIPFARRLTEGLHIPLALLASIGLITLIKNVIGRYVVVGILALTAISFVIYEVRINQTELVQDRVRGFLETETFTVPQSYADGFSWLRENTTEQDVVLSAPSNGPLINGFTGRRIFTGHWGQTILNYSKNAVLTDVFHGIVPINVVLDSFPVTYLWLSREERTYMNEYQVTDQKLVGAECEPVFQNDDVAIYKVGRPRPACIKESQ